MKKIITYQIVLFAFLFAITLKAQLTKITAPDMMTESEIYKDSKGVMFSDIVKFKTKTKMADSKKGEKNVDESKIKIGNIKTALNDVRKKYGDFKVLKAYPDLVWGDTKRIHKRTKKVVEVIDLSQTYLLQFENIIPYDSVSKYLTSIEEIEYAEGPMIAYLTSTNPNDPWYYKSSVQQGPYRWAFDVIKAQLAWDVTHGSPLIRVGVHDRFDSLVALHNEIASKVVWESSWNSAGHHGDHGTMVAGIVGASTNNNTDIASLGWNTSLMLAQWGYQYGELYGGIKKLVENGADIINFSWVTTYDSPTLRDKILNTLQQGVICIASAGNNELPRPGMRYPAGYNFGSLGQVIAVSATEMYNSTERFIPYYNYSPGTNLSSTGFIDFAAPFVSALVALMLSVNSTLTINQVYDILRRTTDRNGQFTYDSNGWNRYLGYGRIDAANAVYVAAGNPAKPRGMSLSWSNNHPKINWEAGEETDLNHYEIYKRKGSSNYAYYASTTNTFYVDYSEYKYSTGNDKIYVDYQVKAVDNQNDKSIFSDAVSAAVNNSIEKNTSGEEYSNQTPTEYLLNHNYPNPFNPSTTISYQIKETGNVRIKIYDALGREITTLVNEVKQPGNYSVTFDADNHSSGIYFVRMQANEYRATKKIILAK